MRLHPAFSLLQKLSLRPNIAICLPLRLAKHRLLDGCLLAQCQGALVMREAKIYDFWRKVRSKKEKSLPQSAGQPDVWSKLFWNGDGEYDLAVGFSALGNSGDPRQLDFCQSVVEVIQESPQIDP